MGRRRRRRRRRRGCGCGLLLLLLLLFLLLSCCRRRCCCFCCLRRCCCCCCCCYCCCRCCYFRYCCGRGHASGGVSTHFPPINSRWKVHWIPDSFIPTMYSFVPVLPVGIIVFVIVIVDRYSVSVLEQVRGLKQDLKCHKLATEQADIFNGRIHSFATSPVTNNPAYYALGSNPSGLQVTVLFVCSLHCPPPPPLRPPPSTER